MSSGGICQDFLGMVASFLKAAKFQPPQAVTTAPKLIKNS
jgi:hypothetical protein